MNENFIQRLPPCSVASITKICGLVTKPWNATFSAKRDEYSGRFRIFRPISYALSSEEAPGSQREIFGVEPTEQSEYRSAETERRAAGASARSPHPIDLSHKLGNARKSLGRVPESEASAAFIDRKQGHVCGNGGRNVEIFIINKVILGRRWCYWNPLS